MRFVVKLLYGAVITLVCLWSCFPIYWAINTSLQLKSDMVHVNIFPPTFTLGNYIALFYDSQFLTAMGNSLAVSFFTVILAIALGAPAAFALARLYFPGIRVLQTLILSISFLPTVTLLGGLLEVVRFLGLYDQFGGLVLSYMLIVLPFTIWSLKIYLERIPREIEESALIDGVSIWRMCTKVFLPLSLPALVTTSLIAFVAAWNDFLLALTMVLSAEKRTATVAVTLISGISDLETPWGQIMAASVVVTVPLLILVLLFQKKVVSGVTAGAVKG